VFSSSFLATFLLTTGMQRHTHVISIAYWLQI